MQNKSPWPWANILCVAPGTGGAFVWGPFRGAGQGLPHGQGASPWGPRDPWTGWGGGSVRHVCPLAGC